MMELHITLKHFFAMEQGDSGIIRKLVSINQFEKLQKKIAKVINSVFDLCQFEMEESA